VTPRRIVAKVAPAGARCTRATAGSHRRASGKARGSLALLSRDGRIELRSGLRPVLAPTLDQPSGHIRGELAARRRRTGYPRVASLPAGQFEP